MDGSCRFSEGNIYMQIIESVCRLLTHETHKQVHVRVCGGACRLHGKTEKLKCKNIHTSEEAR